MKKTAFILMIITIISKALGFLREITLSYFYGASNISDAYFIAQTIPLSIFALIGAGISTSFIPMYSKLQSNKGIQQADTFTNNLLNVIIVICTIIVGFVFVFTVPIIKLFASGFEGETLYLAVNFTRISIFGIYFTAMIYVFKGYLQLKSNFAVTALIALPLNIIMIATIALSVKFNKNILAAGIVIAALSQVLYLIPFLKSNGFKYKWILDRKDEDLRRLIVLALPVILGVSVNQIGVLVDKTLASQISIGGISALNYANILNEFVQGIFVTSIITVMYPLMSKMAAEENMKGLKKTVMEGISSTNLLLVPATVGVMVFAEPIVILLFGRGAFDAQAVHHTSTALFYYSLGMVAFGLREIISKTFYSLQDTKTPVINAALTMLIDIVLNFILAKYMGIGGLALATSISAIMCTWLLFISLRRKIGRFGIRTIVLSFIKITVSSAIMGVVAHSTYIVLVKVLHNNLSLILSMAIGACTYFIVVYFMRIEEADEVIDKLRNKLKVRR